MARYKSFYYRENDSLWARRVDPLEVSETAQGLRISEYNLHYSPTRSAIFDAAKTSRIYVAHFMAALISNDETWSRWRMQMPVIFNQEVSETASERTRAQSSK